MKFLWSSETVQWIQGKDKNLDLFWKIEGGWQCSSSVQGIDFVQGLQTCFPTKLLCTWDLEQDTNIHKLVWKYAESSPFSYILLASNGNIFWDNFDINVKISQFWCQMFASLTGECNVARRMNQKITVSFIARQEHGSISYLTGRWAWFKYVFIACDSSRLPIKES